MLMHVGDYVKGVLAKFPNEGKYVFLAKANINIICELTMSVNCKLNNLTSFKK